MTARTSSEVRDVAFRDALDRLPERRRRALTIALAIAAAAIFVAIRQVEPWPLGVCALVASLTLFVEGDRLDRTWERFLPIGTVTLGVLWLGYSEMPRGWGAVATWESRSVHHLVDWNGWMRSIPLNDARWLWRFRIGPLSDLLRWVYLWSFAVMVWIPVLRSFFARDAGKMLRYALSGHILQFPLILPFYLAVRLDEVWYVLGQPDLCGRGLTGDAARVTAQNCFPSMHTSVAFAMILLARREKNAWFRRGMTVYAGAVIFSTLYMKIHWVLDVVAGLGLGWVTVQIADRIMAWAASSVAVRRRAPDVAAEIERAA